MNLSKTHPVSKTWPCQPRNRLEEEIRRLSFVVPWFGIPSFADSQQLWTLVPSASKEALSNARLCASIRKPRILATLEGRKKKDHFSQRLDTMYNPRPIQKKHVLTWVACGTWMYLTYCHHGVGNFKLNIFANECWALRRFSIFSTVALCMHICCKLFDAHSEQEQALLKLFT